MKGVATAFRGRQKLAAEHERTSLIVNTKVHNGSKAHVTQKRSRSTLKLETLANKFTNR
jgi:hypothetical protein